jgi:hypothetical protein
MTIHKSTFNYAPGTGQDTYFSPELFVNDEVHISFTTPPTLREGGAGGWVGFANQGRVEGGRNLTNSLELSLSEIEGDFSKSVGGNSSGSIHFNTKPAPSWFSWLHKGATNKPNDNVLKPGTTYWINVRNRFGPAPDGIRVKMVEGSDAPPRG